MEYPQNRSKQLKPRIRCGGAANSDPRSTQYIAECYCFLSAHEKFLQLRAKQHNCITMSTPFNVLDWYRTHETLGLAVGSQSLELPARAMRKLYNVWSLTAACSQVIRLSACSILHHNINIQHAYVNTHTHTHAHTHTHIYILYSKENISLYIGRSCKRVYFYMILYII